MTCPDQKPEHLADAFERQARALAHSIPMCDLGSTEGIKTVAIALRETWRMATEAAYANAKFAAAEVRPQNARDDWTEYAKIRDGCIDSVIAQIEQCQSRHSSGPKPYGPVYKQVERILDEHSAWIARPNKKVTDRIALACTIAAMAALEQTRSDFPSDGTCVRCGSAPRNSSGLCATCIDEDAVRTGEVEDNASQVLWRQALDQERVENDGLEECGNWSATDPVRKDRGHDD